jgi:hypothetical protein
MDRHFIDTIDLSMTHTVKEGYRMNASENITAPLVW